MKEMHKGNTKLLGLLLCGMTFVWLLLSNMFSIFSYIESIYFALDKISGHFFSIPIQLTLVFFLLLLLMYGVFIVFLREQHYSEATILVSVGIAAIVCSILALLTYPVGALDLFNYVLMGKLFVFYHQNPFFVPFISVASTDPLSKYAIFLDVTTGYGSWWLLLTSLVVLWSGTASLLSMVLSYKVMTVFFFLLTGVILYLLPEDKHKKILAASIYLLNPFIIFDGIVNAHNDIIVTFFIILAWWAYKSRNVSVFVCLILAGLTKAYVFVLLPLFLIMIIKEKWSKKEIFISLLAGGACFMLAFLPFWEHGKLIHGVLQGLINAQTINGFSLYSLTREFFFTSTRFASMVPFTQLFFAGLFLCVFTNVIWSIVTGKEYLYGSIVTLLAFFLCLTIYQPWYVIPVLGLLSLSPKKSDLIFSFIISGGMLLSYPVSVWAWFHSGWSTLTIHLFLAIFIAFPSLLYLLFLLKHIRVFRSKVLD